MRDKRWRLFELRSTSMHGAQKRDLEGGNIFCRVCGRRFQRWNGTAMHGIMHVDRGEAIAESDPFCPSTSGDRYLFFLREEML